MRSFFYGLGSVVLVFYLLVVGKAFLIPLVLAVFIWYLINVLAVAFRRIPLGEIEMPNWLALGMAISSIVMLLTGVVRLISNNVVAVQRAAPMYQAHLETLMERAYAFVNMENPPKFEQLFQDMDLTVVITQTASALGDLLTNAGLIGVYLVFIFVEQQFFNQKLATLFPDDTRHRKIRRVIEKIDKDIHTYVGLKTLVSVITAIFSYGIMRWVDLDFAEFWAFLIFLLNYIPNIGSLIATLMPSLLALVQFDSLNPFFIVAGGVTSVQFLVANVLEPRLLGNSLNLSPLVIILALVLWGTLWGIVGMFLCVPIMVITMIILSYFPATRPYAIALSKDGHISAE